jgi:hypothetical protein
VSIFRIVWPPGNRPPDRSPQEAVIDYRSLVIFRRPSVIGQRLSAIGYRLSAIGYRLSVIGSRLSAAAGRHGFCSSHGSFPGTSLFSRA